MKKATWIAAVVSALALVGCGSPGESAATSAACEESGCTLTPGYWATHSKYGPAARNAVWSEIGEDTAFFLSGKSWFQALTTPPAGNAYYILAKQFVAARLNQEAGASTGSIADTLDQAEDLLLANDPGDVLADRALRARFVSAAGLLAAYNQGDIGPGHCE